MQPTRREVRFSSRWFRVLTDTITRADGATDTCHYVSVPPAVTVLALDRQHRAVVTRQWIYTLDRDHWRLPSGGVDPDDIDPLAAARRELADETGYRADHWSTLGVLHEAADLTDRACHLYLATGLTAGHQRLEGGEADLDHHLVPIADLTAWVMSGQITHGPSATAILKVALRWGRGEHR